MNVLFFKSITGGHVDPRREIIDVVLPEGYFIPFLVRQVKLIIFNPENVNLAPVGQHYHPEKPEPDKERWELFIANGGSGKLLQVRFRRAGDGGYEEVFMENGDSCLVPPGNSHAFKLLRSGVHLWGLSNLPQMDENDIPDPLF